MACVEGIRASLFAALLAAVSVGPASAQSSSPLAKPTNAARAPAPGAALDAAVQVALMVDGGRIGELWDGASPVAKRAVTREANPEVRNALDIAGGAVLVAVAGAFVVGLIVLGPPVVAAVR